MQRNLKSVAQFLSEYERSERFSNASGDDYYGTFEGDSHSTFTPENLASADGGGRGRPVSKPYIIQIYNSSGSTATAILFGYNDYGTTLQNTASGLSYSMQTGTYQRMVTQSQNKPFDIGLWRFSCANTNQLDQIMTITYVDANGRTCSDPVTLTNYKDAYQQQSTIIDVWYPTKIDGNTYCAIPIPSGTNSSNILTISMFPRAIADQAHQLLTGQGNEKKDFSTPRLSGRNVPVINVQGGGGAKTM